MWYLYSRVLPKKGYVDRYGKLGIKLHKEVVWLYAEGDEEAAEKIAPFNKSKHLKFKLSKRSSNSPSELRGMDFAERIIDLGEVEE